jgi:hypothetical protein
MDIKGLNNISGSMGLTNSWIYNTTDTKVAVKVVGYFNDAVTYEMRDLDCIRIVTATETFDARIAVAAGVVTLSALDTFA